MDLYLLFKIFRRNWYVVALVTVFVVASAMYYVSRQTPTYQASATVELRPNPTLTEAQMINLVATLDKRSLINTIARKVASEAIQDAVIERLSFSPAGVNNFSLQPVVIPQTNLIEIRAKSPDPDTAAAIANATALELSNEASDKVLLIEVIDTAISPKQPIEPEPARVLMLSLVSGLMAGVGLAFLIYAIRDLSLGAPLRPEVSTTSPALEPAPLTAAPAPLAMAVVQPTNGNGAATASTKLLEVVHSVAAMHDQSEANLVSPRTNDDHPKSFVW
jgi:capsular polysaccharide biosynthesis protein